MKRKLWTAQKKIEIVMFGVSNKYTIRDCIINGAISCIAMAES